MKKLSILSVAAALVAGPAMAAEEHHAFFSLANPPFIVLIAFLIFVGALIYLKVPGMLGGMLDKRAQQIRVDLDEARMLREEAQAILASYERKQKEVEAQAERIVAQAREEAEQAAEQAKADLKASIARRLAAAEEQIGSAEKAALREVKDRAVAVAVAAAADVLSGQMSATAANKLIEDSIADVGARLN
ncbi:F0F1 ATP synthase subunit B [Solirhodobacter olei]|uniref:F0F1 ATP synthase subunit B n=1 Tax=Solirhodobacter olei TaxID=2493082 RepID=UPI000FDBEFA2|nr:F0F1 ATP synthase subunit B [Solirhodobacter olei]